MPLARAKMPLMLDQWRDMQPSKSNATKNFNLNARDFSRMRFILNGVFRDYQLQVQVHAHLAGKPLMKVSQAVMLSALISACTANKENNFHQTYQKENVVNTAVVPYFEIPVTDLERATRFYSAVFEVDFTRETVDGHQMALFPPAESGGGASGALAKGDVYVPTRDGVIVYFAVPDIDAVLDRARSRGATMLYEKKDNGIAFVAEFEDSEGNRIAVMQQHE
jgi:predicted enzyme related to lactoylglutathione lyase